MYHATSIIPILALALGLALVQWRSVYKTRYGLKSVKTGHFMKSKLDVPVETTTAPKIEKQEVFYSDIKSYRLNL